MKFVISSSVLLKQLTALSGAIASNPIVPILENFLFEIRRGQLKLTASDSQNSIVAELSVDAEEDCSIAIPAKMLLDTLRNLPEQPVTMSINMSSYSVEIISENGRYKLTGESASDYPRLPEVSAVSSVALSSSAMLKAINSTIFATSTDEHRPAMNGVFVALSPEGAEFVATDAHRLVKYRRAEIESAKSESILIPRKTLTLLKSILPTANTDLTIAYSSNNASFTFANFKFTCRLIDENFPNYQNVIPVNNDNLMTVDRLELIGCLKRMMIYANKSTNLVKLSISQSALQVSAEDIDFSNEATEKLSCDYEGEELEIGFSAKFLIEMLNNLETNFITIKLSAPEKPGLLVPSDQGENEDMLMLLMPVMLTSYQPNY